MPNAAADEFRSLVLVPGNPSIEGGEPESPPPASYATVRMNPTQKKRPAAERTANKRKRPAVSQPRRYGILERETGVEPATLSLGSYLGISGFSLLFQRVRRSAFRQIVARSGLEWTG